MCATNKDLREVCAEEGRWDILTECSGAIFLSPNIRHIEGRALSLIRVCASLCVCVSHYHSQV